MKSRSIEWKPIRTEAEYEAALREVSLYNMETTVHHLPAPIFTLAYPAIQREALISLNIKYMS